MNKAFPIVLALLTGLAATPAQADGQLWLAANTKGQIADGVLLISDVMLRMREEANHPGVIQVRALLGHEFGPVTLAAGYAWVRVSKSGQPARTEHRLTQQMEIKLIDQKQARLTARTMLEERLPIGNDRLSWRLRQRLKLTLPFGTDGFALIGHGELLAALSEGPSGAKAGDVETRIFGGLLIPLTRQMGLEAGYLNQHQWQGAYTTNHALSLTLATKF